MPRLGYLLGTFLACGLSYAQPSTPVILISVDTLRADHLGCYNAEHRFHRKKWHAVLPSERARAADIALSRRVVHFHIPFRKWSGGQRRPVCCRDNAVNRLKESRLHTAAFVGSFVLDRRFGLSRDFDVYDSPFDLHNKTVAGVGDLKRPGALVAAAAIRWLDQNANSPFFLFLHLYDLHTPYDLPPDPSLGRGEAGYEAELAYVDRVLGDFLAFLERRGLLNKSLIVFTSDHGEGLNEHLERTHGYFVYESTLHVPLIFHWPTASRDASQDRVAEPASLLDVAPTILDALGLTPSREMRGQSLITRKSPEEIYSESLYARSHFACTALRTLRLGRYKYIDAPNPELYDLSSDPGESQNLYAAQQLIAIDLRKRMRALLAGASAKARPPTPDTVNALRSLQEGDRVLEATRQTAVQPIRQVVRPVPEFD